MPIETGLAYLETARDIYHRIGDRRGEANALWGLGNYHYFRESPGQRRSSSSGEALEIFREVGDRTMEAWALHMLGTACCATATSTRRARHIAHAIRHFHAAGDAAGLTLTLDDLSAVAVADGDLPRAARLRGRRPEPDGRDRRRAGRLRRGLVRGRGTARASAPRCRADDLARYGAEGAAMTLDEAIAYALEGQRPVASDARHEA